MLGIVKTILPQFLTFIIPTKKQEASEKES